MQQDAQAPHPALRDATHRGSCLGIESRRILGAQLAGRAECLDLGAEVREHRTLRHVIAVPPHRPQSKGIAPPSAADFLRHPQ